MRLTSWLKQCDCVKLQTVISSLTRTDILPVFLSSILVTYATEEIKVVKRGIALVQRLPMDEPIDIEEYIYSISTETKKFIPLPTKTVYSKRL